MIVRVRPSIHISDLAIAALNQRPNATSIAEAAFAAHFGFSHGIFFPYGRSALFALLKALEWKEREILCPSYVCAVVPYAVSASENAVRFVDSAEDHFLPGWRAWDSAATSRSSMAILTPLFGYPLEAECERALRATSSNIFILYDEAQSFGVRDGGGLQCRTADGAFCSFGLGKTITSLSGGMLLLRSPEIASAVRRYRDAYAKPVALRTLRLLARGLAALAAYTNPSATVIDWLGRHSRLFANAIYGRELVDNPSPPSDMTVMPSTLEAELAIRQLDRLDDILAARQRIGMFYDRRLGEERFAVFNHACPPTWPRYPFATADRARVVTELRNSGIQTGLFIDYECSQLPLYRSQGQTCPNAIRWSREMINLPNWFGLSEEMAELVVGGLRSARG